MDLATQGRNADFARFSMTRPVSVGDHLPSTCQVGQLFFLTGNSVVTFLWYCTSVNVWTSAGGGKSAGLETKDKIDVMAVGIGPFCLIRVLSERAGLVKLERGKPMSFDCIS